MAMLMWHAAWTSWHGRIPLQAMTSNHMGLQGPRSRYVLCTPSVRTCNRHKIQLVPRTAPGALVRHINGCPLTSSSLYHDQVSTSFCNSLQLRMAHLCYFHFREHASHYLRPSKYGRQIAVAHYRQCQPISLCTLQLQICQVC